MGNYRGAADSVITFRVFHSDTDYQTCRGNSQTPTPRMADAPT